MLRFASLFAIAAIATSSLSALASPLNPLSDGYSIGIDNAALSSTNTAFNGLTGVLTFTDLTSTWTIAEVNAAPLATAVSITRTCTTLNVSGCAASTVSMSNANFLGGNLQAGVMVNASVQAIATAGVSNVVFAASNASLGASSAIVGYSPATPASSPVPEPGSLGLLATGLVGAAGVLRHRFSF